MDAVRDPKETGNQASYCKALNYFGECNGSVLRWCEGGRVQHVDCSVTGQASGYPDASIGNNCITATADPCGGHYYFGECQGSLLRSCEAGAVRSFYRAAQGETCGYLSDDVENNCIPVVEQISECDRLGYS